MLRRAQLWLILAALVPTVLATAVGIVQIVLGQGSVDLVLGILLLAFSTTAITGYVLASIFVSRGASLARVQNDFVSSVSHELRTPLTSIRLFLETLQGGKVTDPEQQRKCMEMINQEVMRLEGLVTRVIELSRIESGNRVFADEPLRLSDVAARALAAFHVATLSDPVQVETTLDSEAQVRGDESTLALAVTNLLINAWKYTPAHGKWIALTVVPVGDREIDIIVSDNGIGIPKNEQRRIFEQFERGQGAVDAHTSGSGLGLAIVRAIVHAHRGKVRVESREGRGSEFRITLKRWRAKQ